MNVYDHYYDKVTNEKLTKGQLIDIITQIGKLNSFGNNKHTVFELYQKMSEEPVADEELVRLLVEANVSSYGGFNTFTHKILNNGTKKLFDDLWNNGIGEYKQLRYWKCKFADEKQLTEIYKELFESKVDPSHKTWQEAEKKEFFKHPNAPDKLLSRVKNIRDDAALIQMVENPNLTSKPKTFEAICTKVKEFNGWNSKVGTMLEKLLANTSLDWMTVAKGIDLPKQLAKIFSNGNVINKSTKEAFINFCKHKDSTENIKTYMYGKTGDEAFLPQSAKDIFLF
jgi:hypothetical protein